MLDGIKTEFSIRDLENLTGVKAHTIRIWEKRYQLLQPSRSNTNIRTYNIESLKKLLNTSWLVGQGYKISKIATMSDEDMHTLVRQSIIENNSVEPVKNQLKLAMLNFDEKQFSSILNVLQDEMSFRDIFLKVLINFLEDVGRWWMTDVIRPAHEHFVSNLIRQKLCAQIDRLAELEYKDEDELYVLFTPINEIHDLGLLFVHYNLLLKGKRSVYLGQSVPVDDVALVRPQASSCHYVCSVTIRREPDNLYAYIEDLYEKLKSRNKVQVNLFGPAISQIEQLPNHKSLSYFPDLHEYLKKI